MKKKILNIEGMTCSACSNGLEKYLNKQEGIDSATVNLVMATAQVEYDESKIQSQDLERFVMEAGFRSLGERTKSGSKKFALARIILYAVLVILIMYVSMGKMLGIPVLQALDMSDNPITYTIFQMVISTLFLIWGFDILKNGFKKIIHKMPNMDSLVGVGVLVNYIYSIYNSIEVFNGNLQQVHNLYFESSAMIIFFVKLGRYIDRKNKAKAVQSIQNLVTITPKSARIIKNSKEIEVTINEIQKNDIVVCKPGEKIAVDGIITKGTTHTEESFITGESNPVSKNVGDNVLAGSINYDGYIEYKAVNIGKDSSISHIVDLVVEATNTKPPIARIADKISGVFVPTIFIIALISFIVNIFVTKEISEAIISLVSVLVVACPCALGLATPLAMVVALGSGAKKGIVIKASESLEQINKIDTIIMDKTGTITKGELEITNKYFIKDEEQNVKLLKSLELKSNHPLAKSISKNIDEEFEVEEFEEIVGKGIKGKINGNIYYAGNRRLIENLKLENTLQENELEFSKKGESIVYFANENELLGILGLRDEIKESSLKTIKTLKQLNKRIIMLSGDNENTAKIIANEVGIDEVYANVTPDGKLNKIKELNKNQNVIMIGDGINDSPALKEATIGISVSNGTDISSDSSDIILLNEDMYKIIELFKLGRKTNKIIKQNLFWALIYNLLMVPLATGILPISLNPMFASLAMTLSSLTVVVNSLRLTN
ncbi:MAG: cation-translocating P-type ATPase [Clostridia bacterium]|nr:cation-translocating P-type ATPase [Clostridia bacterium]